jgi:hypothetical protein
MTVICKNTIDNIEKLNLHDAEVKDINCNYYDHFVQIPVVLSKTRRELFFDEVRFMDVSLYEPWGAGMYINEITVKSESDMLLKYAQNDDSKLHFYILLNSGDSINVIASKAELK